MIWRPWPMPMWAWLWGQQRPQLQPPSVTHTIPLQVSRSMYSVGASTLVPSVPFFCGCFVCAYAFCASLLCTAASFASAIQGRFSPSSVLWCISSHMSHLSRCDKNALQQTHHPNPYKCGVLQSCFLHQYSGNESHEHDCKRGALNLLLVIYLHSIYACHYVQSQHLPRLFQSSGQ